MVEYEVILQSDNDSYYFKENIPTSFSNLISSYLNKLHSPGIGCFIKIRKIVVSQKVSSRFIVLIEGVPLQMCGGLLIPVVASCHKHSHEKGVVHVYSPGGDHFTPFSLGRESEWRVKIIPWVGDDENGVNTISKCVIHLNVRVVLSEDMTFTSGLMHLKLHEDGGEGYRCDLNTSNLRLREGS